MKQTDLFFSQVIDLKYHTLPPHILDALHAVYFACRAINQPQKYGPAIEVIIIDAVHQDYGSDSGRGQGFGVSKSGEREEKAEPRLVGKVAALFVITQEPSATKLTFPFKPFTSPPRPSTAQNTPQSPF